jgi:hypothetical protein
MEARTLTFNKKKQLLFVLALFANKRSHRRKSGFDWNNFCYMPIFLFTWCANNAEEDFTLFLLSFFFYYFSLINKLFVLALFAGFDRNNFYYMRNIIFLFTWCANNAEEDFTLFLLSFFFYYFSFIDK